jgi:flagellar biosynthesis protein FlhB
MSQEKTEKATPKKEEDARKKGQIARGNELPAALGFLGALLAFNMVSGDLIKTLGDYLQTTSLRVLTLRELTPVDVNVLFIEGVKILAMVSLPIVAVSLAAGLAGNFVQGGFSLSAEGLTPNANKFNPAKNIKKIFQLDSVVNLVKSILKLALLGGVSYGILAPVFQDAPTLINAPLGTIATKLGETIYSLAFRTSLVLLALALADYGYAYYKHAKSLRMSKQEIIDEYKESEGDPMIKGQRRRAARALLQNRSIADVPSASVIITNPTHLAIALRYDRDKDAAPVVVAKGADNMAAKIREIAKENNIPLIENKPLARSLFKIVEPNQIIPAEFFGAVAEILAFVFQTRNK